ncbi:MAG: 30S ribosomal protein S2 [Candidatus Pacearchaeota archaeon]
MARKKEIKKTNGKEYLVDLNLYIKTRIYVGHKIITPDMRPYVFKRKADGVAVFNTDIVDEKLRELIKYLSNFKPDEIMIVGKKQQCWKVLTKFAELTGIKAFVRKYPPGILTNPNLENFLEPKVVFIIDPVADINALCDANRVGIPVVAFCNSNHYTRGINLVVPINNKDEASIGLALYIIAKSYLRELGIEKKVELDDFIDLAALEKSES